MVITDTDRGGNQMRDNGVEEKQAPMDLIAMAESMISDAVKYWWVGKQLYESISFDIIEV